MKKDRIKISSWKNIREFYNMNGFLQKNYIGNDSAYFKGLEKNQVLERLLNIKNRNIQNKQSNFKDSSYLRNIIVRFDENYEKQSPGTGFRFWRPNSKFDSPKNTTNGRIY